MHKLPHIYYIYNHNHYIHHNRHEKQEEMKRTTKLSGVSIGPLHTNVKSFALMPTGIPRLLIIGETQIGKSSFCNKMAGIYYKIVGLDDDSDTDDDGDDQFQQEIHIICEGQKEMFGTGSDQNSVTQKTSWAQVKLATTLQQCVCVYFSIIVGTCTFFVSVFFNYFVLAITASRFAVCFALIFVPLFNFALKFIILTI